MSEVCQCSGKDHTVEICVGQYQDAMKSANKWFLLLQKHCEYKRDVLCYVPLEVYEKTGIIVCRDRDCHLLKEKE